MTMIPDALKVRPLALGRAWGLACLLLFSLSSTAWAASNVRLNAQMVLNGDVLEFQVSSDGSTVVYVADQDSEDDREIFSVPIEGGAATTLNGPLVTNGDVFRGFQISSDSARVVYLADQDVDGQVELYSVPLGGGTVTKLNGPLVSFGNVIEFQITPDGANVVYLADQDTLETDELYRVPIAGGASTKISPPLPNDGDVFEGFLITDDSSTVIYRADQDTEDVAELYALPVAGGSSTKLNDTPVMNGNVTEFFQVSQDGSMVVYRADQDTAGVRELYSAPITGGGSTKLNDPLATFGNVETDFQISPDGSTVVFRADANMFLVFEIFSVPIGGGTVTRLNDPPIAGSDVLALFQITPDSSRVVFVADATVNDQHEIYSVPIGGGPIATINGPLTAGGDVDGAPFLITPDSANVIYLADQDTNDVQELYLGAIEGGSVSTLNDPLVADGDVMDDALILSDDGQSVLYLADQDTDTVVELYLASVAGGPTVKVNDPLVNGGGVRSEIGFSPNGTTIIYRADQDEFTQFELYATVARESDCFNGVDDDCDGLIDCEDPDCGGCQSYDFDGLDAGTVVDEQFQGLSISGTTPVMSFDSNSPTCDDEDLSTPGTGPGNDAPRDDVLILSEPSSDCSPDDNVDGGVMVLVYDVPQRLDWVGLLDIDDLGGATVRVYDNDGGLLASVAAAVQLVDNGWQQVAINECGVKTVEIELTGSGAVTDLACSVRGGRSRVSDPREGNRSRSGRTDVLSRRGQRR